MNHLVLAHFLEQVLNWKLLPGEAAVKIKHEKGIRWILAQEVCKHILKEMGRDVLLKPRLMIVNAGSMNERKEVQMHSASGRSPFTTTGEPAPTRTRPRHRFCVLVV